MRCYRYLYHPRQKGVTADPCVSCLCVVFSQEDCLGLFVFIGCFEEYVCAE